ncbi:MAG: hypothetical protein Q9181_007905 [Wetmoreana brouardii]
MHFYLARAMCGLLLTSKALALPLNTLRLQSRNADQVPGHADPILIQPREDRNFAANCASCHNFGGAGGAISRGRVVARDIDNAFPATAGRRDALSHDIDGARKRSAPGPKVGTESTEKDVKPQPLYDYGWSRRTRRSFPETSDLSQRERMLARRAAGTDWDKEAGKLLDQQNNGNIYARETDWGVSSGERIDQSTKENEWTKLKSV